MARVTINTGVLGMTLNALKRDAEEGKAARGEMVVEAGQKAKVPPSLLEVMEAVRIHGATKSKGEILQQRGIYPSGGGTSMTKDEWVKEAADMLRPYVGEASHEYAEGLYDAYVVEGREYEDDPRGAVEEDMGYWSE